MILFEVLKHTYIENQRWVYKHENINWIPIENMMMIKCITHATSLSCTCLNRFSIKSIQGMVTHPTTLWRVGVYKIKFENKYRRSVFKIILTSIITFSLFFCQHHKREAQALSSPREEVSDWKSGSPGGASTERFISEASEGMTYGLNRGPVEGRGWVKPSKIRMGQSFLEKLRPDLWR